MVQCSHQMCSIKLLAVPYLRRLLCSGNWYKHTQQYLKFQDIWNFQNLPFLLVSSEPQFWVTFSTGIRFWRMLCVVKYQNITGWCFCGNNTWVLWHETCSVDFTFMINFDFYFNFPTDWSKTTKFWNEEYKYLACIYIDLCHSKVFHTSSYSTQKDSESENIEHWPPFSLS